MSTKRLSARVSSARKVGVGQLPGHELVFQKIGRLDGSAKCDIAPSVKENSIVIGVILELSAAQIDELDRCEGLGYGYAAKMVELKCPGVETIAARTYYATSVDVNLRPFHWYKNHVIVGARENALPDSYIQSIEAVESIDDPCLARAEREMAIHRERTA